MTKGHKSGHRELKPSLIGRKVPARRDDSGSPAAAADAPREKRSESPVASDRGRGTASPEVGQDVDCVLPNSGIYREPIPGAVSAAATGKTESRHVHKPRSGR